MKSVVDIMDERGIFPKDQEDMVEKAILAAAFYPLDSTEYQTLFAFVDLEKGKAANVEGGFKRTFKDYQLQFASILKVSPSEIVKQFRMRLKFGSLDPNTAVTVSKLLAVIPFAIRSGRVNWTDYADFYHAQKDNVSFLPTPGFLARNHVHAFVLLKFTRDKIVPFLNWMKCRNFDEGWWLINGDDVATLPTDLMEFGLTDGIDRLNMEALAEWRQKRSTLPQPQGVGPTF